MAAGFPTPKVEIEFVAGTWTDVTADVPSQVQITGGRATEFDLIQAGSCALVLENIPDPSTGIAPYTPDNPLGPHWPNVVENKRVRISATRPGPTTYHPFIGWLTALEPSYSGELNEGTVALTATDILGIYSTKLLLSDYAQQALKDNPTLGADLFLFADTNPAGAIVNSGNGPDTASVVLPTVAGATFEFGSDQGINIDGVFTPTAVQNGAGTVNSTAPVIEVLYTAAQSIEFWYKTTTPTVAGGYTILDDPLVGEMIGLVVSGANLVADFYLGSVTTTIVINDGNWHHFALTQNSTNWDCWVDGVDLGNGIGVVRLATPQKLHLGGQFLTGTQVKPSFCPPDSSYAGFAINHDSTNIHRAYALLNQQVGASERFAELVSYHPLTPATAVLGSNDKPVIRKPTAGLDLLSVLAELVQTVQGTLACAPDAVGTLTFTLPDAARPITLTATLTLESDDDATSALTFKRAVDTVPTRASVDSPTGSVSVINTAAEAAGRPPRTDSLTTASADLDDARNLATAFLTASPNLRIASLAVDLGTAQTDLYAALLGGLLVGARIRVTNVPPGVFGVTYQDEFVQGFVLTLAVDTCQLVLDTTLADAPPEARYGDATYGRYAAGDGAASVSGGTCVGTTGTGTVIVTSTAPWSTVSGDYPMDLDWNAERITVSAPGGSTSPQTFTVTARGVAPSQARSHASGEQVDVFDAARYGF